ncbi:MAG: response regulator transcription factor [Woeseiaceae bacterium]
MEAMPQSRILVVEDEQDIASLVEMHLVDQHFDVTVHHDGHQALQAATSQSWDLMLLDVRLPGCDGLEICKQVRSAGIKTPIMFISAKTTELDRVLGLELGADDYLVKPFSILELLARVKAILRRSEQLTIAPATSDEAVLQLGELVADPAARTVKVNHVEIDLTAREFDLLLHFMRAPGRVFNRAELLDQVWGYGYAGYEHTVNSHINRLRGKIERNPAQPDYVVTVWGVGYKMIGPAP